MKGCSRIDKLNNKDIITELSIFPFHERIIEYRTTRKKYLEKWTNLAFHYKLLNITLVNEQIQDGREEDGYIKDTRQEQAIA
jgi:hypothetical protein